MKAYSMIIFFFIFLPLFFSENPRLGLVNQSRGFFRQHRTIRQEVSGRIFVPIQSSENGGILYVFPIFGTAEVEQKDG